MLPVAILPVQLISTHISQYLTAIELLRCQRVSRQLYRAFAFTPLQQLTAQTSDATAADDSTLGHLAWRGSAWRPTNIQFQHCFDSINWRSLQLLEHLDLSIALQHMPDTAAYSLLYELLPTYCQQLRTLILHTERYQGTHDYSRLSGYRDASPLQHLTRLETLTLDGRVMGRLQTVVSNNPQLRNLTLLFCDPPDATTLPMQLRVLQLHSSYYIQPSYIRALVAKASSLVELALDAVHTAPQREPKDYVDALDELLPACSSLQRLSLHAFYVAKPTLELISNVRSLTTLNLTHCYLDDTTIEGLLLLHQLRSLYIMEPHFFGLTAHRHIAGDWLPKSQNFAQVMCLPALTAFALDQSYAKYSTSLLAGPPRPQFRSLDLRTKALGDDQTPGVCLDLCLAFPNLTELKLPPISYIDDIDMKFLTSRLPALTSLSVHCPTGLTIAGLARLRDLQHLRTLDISLQASQSTMLQQLVHILSHCSALTSLTLRCDRVVKQLSGKSLLAFLPHVRALKITDRSEYEAELQQLVTMAAEIPLLQSFGLTCNIQDFEGADYPGMSPAWMIRDGSPYHYPTVKALLRTFTRRSYHCRSQCSWACSRALYTMIAGACQPTL